MFVLVNRSYLSLLLYAILIGQVGIFARFVDGLDTITIVFYRAGSAALFILLIGLGWEVWRSVVSNRFLLPRRWWNLLLVGLLQAAIDRFMQGENAQDRQPTVPGTSIADALSARRTHAHDQSGRLQTS